MLAAATLAGGLGGDGAGPWSMVEILAAMTLFYTGGMYLNDACDRAIDARERPSRPIPAGLIAGRTVFAAGFAMLALGLILMARQGAGAFAGGALLAALILAYDLHHKGFALSPVVMGACRGAVYLGTGLAVAASLPGPVLVGAAALFAHVIGLTYAARQESLDRIGSLWPLALLAVPLLVTLPLRPSGPVEIAAFLALAAVDLSAVRLLRARGRAGRVPAAVARLIAAIALVDAALVAPASPGAALVCMAAFGLTLALQRVVPGT